jgi:hypothetical protein
MTFYWRTVSVDSIPGEATMQGAAARGGNCLQASSESRTELLDS